MLMSPRTPSKKPQDLLRPHAPQDLPRPDTHSLSHRKVNMALETPRPMTTDGNWARGLGRSELESGYSKKTVCIQKADGSKNVKIKVPSM
jgi:hypothetical protein